MCLTKLILLTYKPHQYKKGLIAIHKTTKLNNKLSNLKWGTRKDQAKVMLNNPTHRKRVSMMAKNYHQSEKNKAIAKQFRKDGLTIRQIAQKLKLSEMTIYNYFRKSVASRK